MSSFHGNFFVRSTDLLAMPAVPEDQSYAIEVQIEDTITSPFVVFQTAVLHSTCTGALLAVMLAPNTRAPCNVADPIPLSDPQVNAASAS